MKRSLIVLLLTASLFYAQGPGSKGLTAANEADSNAAMKKASEIFPKFYAVLKNAQRNEPLVKQVLFVRAEGRSKGPAFAQPPGTIRIDISFIEQPRPLFDDNRLVVVIEHEIGHLHYYHDTQRSDWNPENSEKAAFEYSLKKTREMAEKGDCAPLQSGLKFMKMRSEGNNLGDAHVRALKRMVNEPLYAEYVAWAAQHCPAAPQK